MLLSFVPGLNLIMPALWFGFSAWLMAVQFADYASENQAQPFRYTLQQLAQVRARSLGFGACASFTLAIPFLNFFCHTRRCRRRHATLAIHFRGHTVMKPRPFHHRIIASIIAICAHYTQSTATLAAEFWGHRYSKQVDIRYGEQPGKSLIYICTVNVPASLSYFAADPTPRPTLVWIHGGGWVAGDKARETPWLIPYLQRGWNVANVNYRQGPRYSAPSRSTTSYAPTNASAEILAAAGMPLDQVVVSGASAGGHLALVVGMRNSEGEHPCQVPTPPKAVVNWFGITDIEAVHEFLRKTKPESNYAASWIGDLDKNVGHFCGPLTVIFSF